MGWGVGKNLENLKCCWCRGRQQCNLSALLQEKYCDCTQYCVYTPHMQCSVARHITNKQQQYTELLIHLHYQSTCSQTHRLSCGFKVGWNMSPGMLISDHVMKGDSPEWCYPKWHPSFSPSGGKVYCQPAFVVSLKRFAAVSIKRHRSNEMPPTEIPTEEGEEEEKGGWYKH